MELQTDFCLRDRWACFLEDFVATLLNPSLAHDGNFTTTEPLFTLCDYGLQLALLSLLNSHQTSIVFTHGLPNTPHDAGYDIWSITVSPTGIECLVVMASNQKVSKVGKKSRRFNEIAAKDPAWEGLRAFRLPIKVRFEGGRSKK